MQKRNHWFNRIHYKLFIALCSLTLLGQGVLVQPVQAGNGERPTALAASGQNKDQLAAVSPVYAQLDVFPVADDGHIYHVRYSQYTGWGSWVMFGNPSSSVSFQYVAAVSWGSDRVDLFGQATDRTVYHRSWNLTNNTWTWWESLGVSQGSGLKAVSWGSGRIDLFNTTITYGSFIQYKWFDSSTGQWGPSQTGWAGLSKVLTSRPVSLDVASWGTGRLDVVIDADNDSILHQYYANGTWHGWTNLGSSIGYMPSIVSWAPGRLDVFARSADLYGLAYHKAFQNGWSGWGSIGGVSSGRVTAVSWGPNRLDLFQDVGGHPGGVNHKAWTGSAWYPSGNEWNSWELVGGDLPVNPATPAVALATAVGHIDLFTIASGQVWTSWTNNSGATWATWQSIGP